MNSGTHSFEQTTDQSSISVTIFSYFLRALRKKNKGYFIQVGATAHIASYSICVLKEIFEDRMTIFRLRPEDLNPCDLYMGKHKIQCVFK
jgi:hypothetical protein